MEANLNKVLTERIKRTISALQVNNFNATYVPTSEQALALVKTMLEDGQTIGTGGSVTLAQTGIADLLKSGKYQFSQTYQEAHNAKTFLMSSNAITESGFLLNVDGRSNRVSALLNGPENVIIVAGINKIVPNIESAFQRVKRTVAPANCIRLGCETPCSKTGECVNCTHNKEDFSIPNLQQCPNTICCNYVISGPQRIKGRITVIIVGEELGY